MLLNNCSGRDLPEAQQVGCPNQVDQFDDCCSIITIDEEVLLHQILHYQPDYYYWLFFQADETPLTVCNFEQYLNLKAENGRRADYLSVGWYNGDCYLVVMELRNTLVKADQTENKVEQVRQSIETLISDLLPHIQTSDIFGHACHDPDTYKIVGVIIPVQRSMSRAMQTQRLKIDTYDAVIVSLPSDRIKQCRLSWSDLLVSIGL